jgi:hypothetical protein
MLQRGIKWGMGLIALYLIVANATGFGTDVTNTASGSVSLVKALQGR